MRKETAFIEQQLTIEEMLGYSLKEDLPPSHRQHVRQATIRFTGYRNKVRANYVRLSAKSNNNQRR